MPRPKSPPRIYRRKDRKGWYAFISDKEKHISLQTDDEDQARARFDLLLSEHQPRAKDKTGVYFIRVGAMGPIKIGTSTDIDQRFVTLQAAHHEKLVLLATMPGDLRTERQLHIAFADARIHGEWFLPQPELLDFIAKKTSSNT